MNNSSSLTGIILGNGFDIAYNYNTGYTNFIQSELFSSLLENGNSLAKYINEVKEIQKWVDVEIEIGKYSYNMKQTLSPLEFREQTPIFKSEFIALRNALSLYISSQTSSKSNKKMDELVWTWFEPAISDNTHKVFITTLNYHQSDNVNTINRYKDYIFEKYPLQIHGQADFYSETPCDIVLGVDEKNLRAPEHNFIVKSFDKSTNATPYFRTIPKCGKYIIFGCSIGETDLRYFKPLFSQRGKIYEIYGFGEDGLIEVKSRISDICDFDKFITVNNVNFKDSAIYSNR